MSSVHRRLILRTGLQAAAGLTVLARGPAYGAAFAASPASESDPALGNCLAVDRSGQRLYKVAGDGRAASAQLSGPIGGGSWMPLAVPAPQTATGDLRLTCVTVGAGDPGSLYVAGPGHGVLHSADDGRTWSSRNDGLANVNVTAITAHAEAADTVYAYIGGHGIFRSEDRGQRWRLMDAGPRGGVTRFVHSNLPGSMQTGWLFVAGPNGVRRSMDCFCAWRDAGEIGRAVHSVAFDPQRPQVIHAATRTGLLDSADGGETWSVATAPDTRVDALVVARGGVVLAIDAAGKLLRRGGETNGWTRLDA